MLAGGAEELSGPAVAVFDTLYATSTRNDEPHLTPRPFDIARDGLVVGEGAATLVLEEYEHALARGARIHAEIVGFGCNSDGAHMTQPTAETMALAMQLALDDARLPGGSHRVRQRARHGDRSRRRRGKPRDRADLRRAYADQLAEELCRPYAGRVRRARGVVDDRDDEAQLVCADAQPDAAPIRPARRSTTSWTRRARSTPNT